MYTEVGTSASVFTLSICGVCILWLYVLESGRCAQDLVWWHVI